MSNQVPQIVLQRVPFDDLEAAHKLEVDGFPPDEAASLSTFCTRHAADPSLFLGAYLVEQDTRPLVGYISATRSASTVLTHESMHHHEPGGASVCIHSVCIASNMRRLGIALRLLAGFVETVATMQGVSRILLVSHEDMVGLYEKAGFYLVGKSDLVLGTKPCPLKPPTKHPSSLFHQLKLEQIRTDESCNAVDLLCPRAECGSLILKQGLGHFETKEGIVMDPQALPLPPSLEPLPSISEWWLVTPSPMQFENIGFTRPTSGQTVSIGKPLKFLICAECDLGPLGWCEEGSREFWLSARRVRYVASEA